MPKISSSIESASAALLQRLFRLAVKQGASDIHLAGGRPPVLRLNGDLAPIKDEPAISDKALLAEFKKILTPPRYDAFEQRHEIDLSYALPSGERFRLNVYWKRGVPALAARSIPIIIPTLEDLEAPEAALDFVNLNQGFVLVTGPTGSGKSTLLASMIERINQKDVVHIITLEDPVEFVYQQKKSLISQRELETDFMSFAEGLKHVFRQDPDIVLIGELRDPESISAALTLAETGHLVFSTLHTNSAPETVDRLIDVFPAAQQQQIRMQLSMTLKGVISQLLIPTLDGKLTAVHEVLINNHAVSNIIREAKSQQLRSTILTSTKEKMVDRDQELQFLVKEKRISKETARQYAHDPRDFA